MTYADPDYMTKWRAEHKTEISDYNKKDHTQRQKDPIFRKKKAKSARTWYSENLERGRTTRSVHYRTNRVKYCQQGRERYAENPEKFFGRSLRKYGLTLAAYYSLLELQKNGCALCGSSTPGSRTKHFCVDHDHTTGKVRGLLCNRCNRALGLAHDDSKLLLKMAAYVRKHRTS